jgi:undecaprenyl-diphosphatase
LHRTGDHYADRGFASFTAAPAAGRSIAGRTYALSSADPLRSHLVSWFEVVVLGIVQGLTEFLPISSSAHLRIVSGAFFGNDPGAAFTAVSQLGTEAAVLVYFARDIGRLIAVWFRGLRSPEARADPDYRLAWLVIIGTIPIAVLGVLFKHAIETVARNLWLIATTMIVFGVLLGLAEYYGRQRIELRQMKVADGVILGFAQACALIPGVSRSGGTITAGLFLGLKRTAAVRYSFLLAIPAVVAAGLFTIPDIAKGGITPAQMIVATVIAFVVGFAVIAWLLRFVAKHTVYVFVWYRIALGVLLFAALGAGLVSAT